MVRLQQCSLIYLTHWARRCIFVHHYRDMSDRIEKLQQFLKDQPKDSFLRHALALEFIKAGNEHQAQMLFEQNMQDDPGYVATYYHLGKVLERKGEQQAAIAIYETGMRQAKQAGDNHSYNELQAAYEDLVY